MLERNVGCPLDLGWLEGVHVNAAGVTKRTANLLSSRTVQKEYEAAWLLKAITCLDLTTLGADDTPSNVSRLCFKAAKPIAKDILNALGFDYAEEGNPIRTAAVCVYPAKVEYAAKTLKGLGMLNKINIAAVATAFPSGQMPLKTRLEEIKYAVQMGANEIDIVIDRSLVLTGQWELLYQEIKQMKAACGPEAHMKAILAVGELDTLENVFKASLVAMMAGSDFIKTSTGKEGVNATIPFGIVMCRAIREYEAKTGFKIGLKPAGGIRTGKDAVSWLILIKEELGSAWLNPELFRIGASGLLTDIEKKLFTFVTGQQPQGYEFEYP